MSWALKHFIKEVLEEERKKYNFGGSQPDENYESELLDDPDFDAPSVYVPNDIKGSIKKWASDMGLYTSRRK
jgi:hypothetical protein